MLLLLLGQKSGRTGILSGFRVDVANAPLVFGNGLSIGGWGWGSSDIGVVVVGHITVHLLMVLEIPIGG